MQNKKNWFYKMLFSYLPIFFFISSILFLIFFLAFSEHIKATTFEANAVFSEQVNQAVDNYLKPVDQMITKEIVVGDTFRKFFNDQDNAIYTMYELTNKLSQLTFSFPNMTSVYVFRQTDQVIISDNMVTDLNSFADRAFVLAQLKTEDNHSWTGRRMYQDHKKFVSVPVVSLVRKVPFYTGEQGLIVVNISVASIQELVIQMFNQKTNYVRFYDGNGDLIFTSEDGAQKQNNLFTKHLTQLNSPYSGWQIRSGIRNGEQFSFFSAFPYVWVSLGFISILMGSLLIIYVTRRNYKPIEAIINRINDVIVNKNTDLFAKGNQDEMRFIEMAIDNLLEQSNKFQNQYKEDLIHIRRNLFMELLEGNRLISPDECKSEMKRLGCHHDFNHIVFSVLEIDKYAQFCEQYSDRDQYLLKFVLSRIVNEIAQSLDIHVWTEWTNNSQLGIIYLFENASEQERTKLVLQHCDKAILWVNNNLHFTITFGNAGETDKICHLPQLFEDALEALKYKPVLGNQRVINYWELLSKPKMEIFHHVQQIRIIAQSYRMGEEAWRTQWDRFFYEVRIGMFPREDIASLIHYLIFYLDREVVGLAGQIQDNWKESVMPVLTKMLDNFETLEEFQTKSLELLLKAESQISSLRESRLNHHLIHEVKKYIGDNYANPDLSLEHLSEEFNLSARYLSRLFKVEFGEKFMDYLVRVRIEHAKQLLQSTEEPVHEIAQKVGYWHSFSFIRVFKKLVGVTPGDFRKLRYDVG